MPAFQAPTRQARTRLAQTRLPQTCLAQTCLNKIRPALACLGLALALCGCHLIDQRDFNAAAGRPPTLPAAIPGPPSPPSLVTIRYSEPEPAYRPALASLVQKALVRKRDVLFSVTTRLPAGPLPNDATASGREVAQAIVDDGAEPGQVEQAIRQDPGATVKEVAVNVH